MKICKFDPFTGDTSFITQSEHQVIKAKRLNMKKKVIMCVFCKSIIHESTIPCITDRVVEREDYHELVQSLKNGRTEVEEEVIYFYCNSCGNQIGVINQPSSYIHIFRDKVLCGSLVFKQKKNCYRNGPQQIKISCYSGLKIIQLKRLIVRLMYLKCSRYQRNLTQMTKNLKSFLLTLNNFIQVFNAYKSAEQNSIKKRKRMLNSFYLNDDSISISSISQNKSVYANKYKQLSNSLSKQHSYPISDDIKGISALSTTAGLNSSYRENRHLSPIKQIVE